MEVSFYLKRPESKTETAIFARISYNGNKLKYYIPEKIYPKFWNKDTQRAKETQKFPEHPEFNARLNSIEASIKNIYRKYTNDHDETPPGLAVFKELIDRKIKKAATKKDSITSFFPYFEDFIKRSKEGNRVGVKTKKGTTYGTNKGYTTTINHLKDFQKKYKRKIDFDTIDLEFYQDFTRYLTKTIKLSNNSIGSHIKRIKTVLNEATEQGINKNLAFRSRYFLKLTEDSDSIYLTENEIKEIEALDLSDNLKLDRVRDLFLVGCYTGLRYSDYSILRPDQIKDGFIETTQVKTGDPVVIPIHPAVERILAKYEGCLPKSISNQKTNNYLKELGQLQSKEGKDLLPSLQVKVSKTITKGGIKVIENYKKWELLSTHTARRSFATNEFLAGTASLTIMAITGHRTEKAFLKYIKVTPNEHAKILKLQWQKRHEMHAV